MPNFCAAPNCTRKSTQSDLAFFRFPRDPVREHSVRSQTRSKAEGPNSDSDGLCMFESSHITSTISL